MGVPRGFYELADASQFSPPVPAFVRGSLLSKNAFNSNPNTPSLLTPPRTLLYGGPLASIETAREWDRFLFFWAEANDKIWLSSGIAPIVPATWLQWPSNSSFQWTWVSETGYPKKVVCSYESGKRVTKWA